MADTPATSAPEARWWGWPAAEPPAATEQVLAELAGLVGAPPTPRAAMPLELVEPPPPRLSQAARTALSELVELRDDATARVLSMSGSAYPDLVRRRRGHAVPAPDAVVYPHDAASLAGVLRSAVERHVALVPRGGATGTVGGVDASGAAFHDGLVVVDCRLLRRVLDVDPVSRRATFGAGIMAPAIEAAVRPYGLTLAHQPQGFELASLGGLVASRSQAFAGVGADGIEDRLRGVRLAAPAGVLEAGEPQGPDLLGLVCGSEGALGVIEQATLALCARPEAQAGRALRFARFADGLAAARRVVQQGAGVDSLALLDEVETRLAAPLLGLRRRGRREEGCLLVVVASGSPGQAAAAIRHAVEACDAEQPDDLGHEPARAWLLHRYRWPALRDAAVDAGYLVDTLDVAARWSALPALIGAVTASVEVALDGPVAIGWQLAHAVADAATLWLTVRTAVSEGAEIERWRAVREAALGAVLAEGGALRAIGSHNAPWLARARGRTAEAALRALKLSVDPTGVMNPGKLLHAG